MVNRGHKHQDEAINYCEKVNAGLPLPKSKGEVDEFLKITGSLSTWIGITDSTKSGKKAAWKDLEGNLIGSRFVNLRVKTFTFSFFILPLTLLKVENIS